ncbi:MAG: NAD(P)-dependent malic enzyme [Nocardioidaceae bacterium]
MGAKQAGKIEVRATVRLESREDLARAYTPGVGDEVRRVADDPSAVNEVTGRANAIFIVTDGSAILGLGDVGPQAGLPVMEGKAALFKTFAGVNAWPLCVSCRDVDEVVRTVAAVAAGVGGINVEDVAAPRCFEIVRRLQEELDIPVFHDDQHGTAIVVLAALSNALRVVEKSLEDVRVVVSGAGAAGSAVSRLLLHAGAGEVVVCDSKGALGPDRDDLEGEKKWLAEHTNRSGAAGSLAECLRGADVFVGVSAPDLLDRDDLAAMSERAIAFGLANPDPEFDPRDVPGNVAVVATGRSDYPNQINNVLAFPGVFRGLLDGRLRGVDEDVQAAAAEASAGLGLADRRGAGMFVPDVFDDRLVPAVADAVAARS